jgi:aspartyl-tRNA(Asn)/glutamyl-tRNA(Gln) amidotransferase subunit A
MHSRTLSAIATDIASGARTPVRVVEDFLSRIQRCDTHLNTYVRVDEPLEQALQLEALVGVGRGALHGIPLAIKDLIDISGEITSAASNLFAKNVARQDAEVIRRLRQSGAIFLGKTNLHEFAYGGSGVIGNRGPARNPWDTARITGGSSSGSAAAVAAGLCAAAVGTDTAGSIRLPASFCGIVGFKPSYGLVSTAGVIPLASSYDHVGPMTLTVADARTLFEAMLGSAAPSSAPAGKLRIGIPESYFYRDVENEVETILSSALSELKKAGHTLVSREFPVDEDRTLASAESYAYHAKWVEQSPELYQPQTLRRIRSGEKITPDQVLEAQAKLTAIRKSAAEIFADIDVLLVPTVSVLPPPIDELLGDIDSLRHREMLMLRNTRPFNVLGTPAISIPWDLSPSGLPVGIQLAAGPGRDFALLAIAEAFESIAPWQGRTPPEFS